MSTYPLRQFVSALVRSDSGGLCPMEPCLTLSIVCKAGFVQAGSTKRVMRM